MGMLFDWESWWALELTSGPTRDMDYLAQIHKYYKAFYDNNIQLDILKVTSDFGKYKILVAPLLYMMKEGVAERISEYVRNGGILVATYMTGIADENDHCRFGAYPGELRETLGIWVEETQAMYPDEKNTIVMKDGSSYECGFLCDVIHTTTAEVLGEYGADFFKGSPCVTRNIYGKGQAYYLAAEGEEAYLSEFTRRLCEEAKVTPLFKSSRNIEICARDNKNGRTYFLINHSEQPGEVELGKDTYIDMLAEETLTGTVAMNGMDVKILKKA